MRPPPLPARAATSLPRGARIAFRSERGLFTVASASSASTSSTTTFSSPSPARPQHDHLASGLVPLGLLALAAAAYPRLRAGARATIALVLGILALVVGAASGGYETLTVGASGDDYTGLLALPAGLVLLALGRRDALDVRASSTTASAAATSRRALLVGGAFAGGLSFVVSARPRLRGHARHPAERSRGKPRRFARGRLVHDERRPRAPGLVRPLEERRRRDRLPGPQRPAGTRADARAPRLRRPPLRPARRRSQRRRQQPLRLGRRQGPPGRDRVPEGAARRRPAAGSAESASPSAAS